MTQDQLYKTIFFGVIFALELLVLYLYGRKARSGLLMPVTIGCWIILVALAAYNGALAGMFSVLVMIGFAFFFKRSKQVEEFRRLYAENKIYASDKKPFVAISVMGDKNWICSEGLLHKNINDTISYQFLQGSVSSYVVTGKYSHTTAYTYYLAFVFASGTVTGVFKQYAKASADRSAYPFLKKLKFFFVPDTETPCLVTTAADGSFIIEYLTIPDVEHYTRRIEWLKAHIGRMYFSSSKIEPALG